MLICLYVLYSVSQINCVLNLFSSQVNLADSCAGKEARIQEVETKLTHCQATCNRIAQEARMSAKIAELEREISESLSFAPVQKYVLCYASRNFMEKELCSTKDAAAVNEQRLGAELSTACQHW